MAMGKNMKRPDKSSQEENQSEQQYHVPVLLTEAVDALNVRTNGIYIDCTFGGGGHSREILKRLGPEGKLLAFDQDPDAKRNLPADDRLIFVPHNFRYLLRFMKMHQIDQADGLLADLGVSSHQFNEPTRGFSTRFDGPLDMRMDPALTTTASTILTTYSQDDLQRMFSEYGEVTNARTLASAIVLYRQNQSLETIAQFKVLLQGVIRGNPKKYQAQVFQALRIEVNQELSALKELLYQLPAAIKPGGRAAIISFHSLEDRLVKQFFRDGEPVSTPENPFSREEKQKPFFLITRKPIEPGENEIHSNPRSRSARLRVAEKSSSFILTPHPL
jgi:16S rRNA (cytosine1402-N4)-methyltransferase